MSRGHHQMLHAMQSLADVGDEALQWLADHVEPVSFAAGEQLIVEGATDRDCYFIVSGRTRATSGGSTLGDTGPGEPEGEMGLLLETPRAATTTALEPVEALRLRASDFDGLRAQRPDVAAAIHLGVMRHLARRFGAGTNPPDPPDTAP